MKRISSIDAMRGLGILFMTPGFAINIQIFIANIFFNDFN